MPSSSTPDLVYDDRKSGAIRPSWSANPGYLDQGHREIFAKTKDLPGWQAEGDSYKLYEMAHFAGDVILEIGVYGGRSAVVELRGALSNRRRQQPPQFYGIDLDPEAIKRSYGVLVAEGLAEYALLYLGGVESFASRFAIRPTMVFVDADHAYEGVKRDLTTLSAMLPPGVPVLCHDYLNPENDTGQYGVRRAATEWEAEGDARFCGTFGVAALFVTTERCRGPVGRLADEVFTREREGLLRGYGILPAPEAQEVSLWRTRAQAAEAELQRVYQSRTYRLVSALSRGVVQPLRRSLRGSRAGR